MVPSEGSEDGTLSTANESTVMLNATGSTPNARASTRTTPSSDVELQPLNIARTSEGHEILSAQPLLLDEDRTASNTAPILLHQLETPTPATYDSGTQSMLGDAKKIPASIVNEQRKRKHVVTPPSKTNPRTYRHSSSRFRSSSPSLSSGSGMSFQSSSPSLSSGTGMNYRVNRRLVA